MRVSDELKHAVRRLRRVRAHTRPGLESLDYQKAEIRMFADTRAARMRLRSCAKEPWTVAWIETHLKPGQIFWDLGASTGPYALVAHAAHGGRVRVVAIEPAAASYADLCRNVAVNAAGATVTPLPIALGDRTSLGAFHYRDTAAGEAMHRLAGQPSALAVGEFAPAYTQPMMVWRLDDLLDTFPLAPPDHLKLDVDGSELAVIRGGPNTLARIESAMVEVDDDSAALITDKLSAAGLAIHTSYERRVKGGRPVPHWYVLYARS